MKPLTIIFSALLILSSCAKDCEECRDKEDLSTAESLLYPDGMMGEPVLFMADTLFTVPEGKTFYIHNCSELRDGSGTREYFFPFEFGNDYSSGEVIIVSQGRTISSQGFLNGLLVDRGVEVFSWDSEGTYVVPDGKILYLTSFKSQYLMIDDDYVAIWVDEDSKEVASPIIIPAGHALTHREDYIFTGYFRDL